MWIKPKLNGIGESNSSWNALHTDFYESGIFKVILHNASLSLSTSTKGFRNWELKYSIPWKGEERKTSWKTQIRSEK